MLSAVQVRALVSQPSLQVDFSSLSDVSNQANRVTNLGTPSQSGNRATFIPDDFLRVDGPFSFATWIKPVKREEFRPFYAGSIYPMLTDVVTDTWQMIAGNEVYKDVTGDDDVYETIDTPYPTLAHDNDGRLR